MRFGICTDSANASLMKELGYDFVELGVAELAPERPEDEFRIVRERIGASGLRAEAFNKFIPKGIALVGPDVDLRRARAYVATALGRAAEIGGQTIVWGSPHARHVPDGFSRERAFDQLVEIGRFMGEVAARYGQVVVVEPLDATTTNTIWTVRDGYDLALRVDHPNVKTMADIYQMYQNDEPLTAMAVAGEYLAHVHVSDPDRMPPGNPQHFAFYEAAFAVLQQMSYDGRVSVEARLTDLQIEGRRALDLLRGFAGAS